MSELKYNIGDRVRIKSLDWYNENKDEDDNVVCLYSYFDKGMSEFCDKIVTIKSLHGCPNVKAFRIIEDNGYSWWSDDMIEGLVKEENKPKFKVGDEVRIKGTDIGGTIESVIRGQLIVNSKGSKIPAWPEDVVLMKSVEEETKPKYEDEVNGEYYSIPKYLVRPNGYQFVDENGNVINAMKIVLEKKKKEYPKTYEECCKIIHSDPKFYVDTHLYSGTLETLYKLLICRDAYWKIAGDEMGLGKPWEPDWRKERYIIYRNQYDIIGGYRKAGCAEHHIFEFPSPVMRDDFEENFGPDIDICKTLL